jgi:hypothetical protein
MFIRASGLGGLHPLGVRAKLTTPYAGDDSAMLFFQAAAQFAIIIIR